MITSPKYKPENGALKIKLPVRNPLEDYESWYFESFLDNGNQIRISYRINETYSLPILYGVQVELIEDEQVSILSESFTSSEVEFSSEKCNHKLGNNWILDLGGYFEIHAEINGTIIQLRFYPEIEGFNNRSDSVVNQNISGTKFMGWNIPVPKAKVTGFIDQKGQKANVKGIGYHDHIWGNSTQNKEIKQLCLGKIHDGDLLIYYTLVIEHGQSMLLGKLIAAHKDNKAIIWESSLLGETIKAKIVGYDTVEETGDKIPKQIILRHNDIELNIALKEIFLRKEFMKHRLGGKYFFRFLGEESYKLKFDKKIFSGKTNSLHEVLIF